MFSFKGYKMFCENCDKIFIISDEEYLKNLTDMDYKTVCPDCNSEEINVIEVEGERKGY